MEEHKCEHNDISYPKGLKWTKQRKCVYQVLEEATEYSVVNSSVKPTSAPTGYCRIVRIILAIMPFSSPTLHFMGL